MLVDEFGNKKDIINGKVVEFLNDEHIYLVDGVITSSVSNILRSTLYKDKYKGVSSEVLANAATFGTNVHAAIENDTDVGLTELERKKYLEYKEIEEESVIIPIAKEQMILYEELYCGQFDLEAIVGGNKSLLDVKTTYQLDIEYISWQLSLYAFAKGVVYDKFYTIWLPKRKKGKLVEIEQKTDEEVLGLLELYKKGVSEDELPSFE